MANRFLSNININDEYTLPANDGSADQVIKTDGAGNLSFTDVVAGEADKALSLTLRVKNTESVALTKGQVVCASPTATPPSGNVIEVKLADNNGTDSMPAIGVLNEGLDAAGGANDEGEAIMFGRISGINTSAFSVGDEVFVSDTPGGLTTTKPTGVKYIQKVGVVMRDDASNGTIEVFGAGRTNDVPTPLYVDHLNQRIGIGEETPSSQLHINNDVAPPVLTLSYAPSGGYGGGADIKIVGGSSDYVYGGVNWYNGGLRDARLIYAAASREMSFRANERGVGGNGYFRFYNGATEIAEINSAGVYGNVFYDQGNTAYYLNPASTSTALNTPLGSARVKDVFIGNATGQISNRVWFDNGSSNQPGLYFEGGQPKFIIYSAVSNIFHDTYHPNADTWTTGRTITIGDTGKSVDGSADVSWSLSEIGAAASSHNHDDRYYTETESDSRFVNVTGDTMTGALTASGGINGLTLANGISGSNFNITGVNQLSINDPGEGIAFGGGSSGTITLAVVDDSNDNILRLSGTGASLQVGTSTVWHAGNDGSGSGLDADLLDGQQGTYYLDYNNFTNTPTIPSAYNHPTHPGDDINLDTGALSGATVISDLDFNITTDTLGHVTDANATYSTRNLTASDIGAAASSHEHTWAEINGATSNSINGWGGLRHTTNSGYIDFGPANSSHAHIYTDMPDFYLNKRIQISGGSQLNASDVRSAIFYDLNNTAYYLNPASTSNLQELEILRNSSNYTVNLTDAHDRAGLMIKSSTNFDSKIAFSSGASSRQYIQALNNAHTTGRDIAINPYGGNVAIGKEAPAEALDVDGSITSNATIWTGYDCGVTNSISCSNWFRSSGSSGWFNATYSGGIHMSDSTWVRVYNNKKFYNQNTIESNSGMYAPIFYDRNNTNYRFHGDLSHNNVDLTSSGNYAIHVAGTISGGHRKHGNLETPEMDWSIGGGTDLNWKKLCDVVISDASYSGWGAEIEITDFSGNYGNATYNGGELFKGALSIYHWGGTGDTTETAYANIPYDMRSYVRWYKINESGQNRYQLQVKSPANYRQLYVKVKPGIGNQVADIISYANDTNGTTSGGTAYASIQNSNFNHEFAGGIWTNDTRDIGWKNSYGNPHLSSYYGAITTSASLYVGGPTSTTTQLYAGPVYGSVFYDRNSSTYYMDGSSTGDSIRVAGDVVAYYSSDKRYKENIKPIENALDKVKAINGVTFNWNEKSHKETGKKDVGVIAQEVEEVLPEIVETRRNGYKAVDYQKLTAVLIESVKELTAKVEALEAKQCNCK